MRKQNQKPLKIKADNFPLVHLLGSDEEKVFIYKDWRCSGKILEEVWNEWKDLSDNRANQFKEALALNPNLSEHIAFQLSQINNSNIKNLALCNANHPSFHRKILSEFHRQCLLVLFEQLKSEANLEILIREGCFLTGGAVCSLVRNSLSYVRRDNFDFIKDFDFYFNNEQVLEKVINHFINNIIPVSEGQEGYFKYDKLTLNKNSIGFEIDELKDGGLIIGQYKKNPQVQLVITNNAVTLKSVGRNSPDFQFIFKICQNKATDTVAMFDFAHCQGIIQLKDGSVIFNPESFFSMTSRQLFFKGGINPLKALIRMKKFSKRGWSISEPQMVKMAAYISAKVDFSNPKALKDQMRGFYCESTYPELFTIPEGPLTLEELMEWLDQISY